MSYEVLQQTYSKVKFTVEFNANEINRGKQYFCIYNERSKNSQICIEKFNLPTIGKENLTHVKTFVFELNLSDFAEGKAYIMYGAKGMFGDDWMNYNMHASFEYYN